MKSSTLALLPFIAKPHTRFTIPTYQRTYSWRERQCRELWLDIDRAVRHERDHFLGTILYTRLGATDAETAELSVIDGQQRLTTIMLLLDALAAWLDEHDVAIESPSGPVTAETIRRTYLTIEGSDPNEAKLRLSPTDAATLEAVMQGDELPPDASRTIRQNLELFTTLMAAEDFDVQKLWQGLSRLTIIAVEVENARSVQSYFESLNSKGLPLNVADLARNYLLLSENHAEQTRLYNEYWAAMEEIYHPDPGSKRMDSGIRAWLSIRLRTTKILTVEQSFSEFKRYVEDKFHGDKENILRELVGFSLMWAENFRYHGVKKYKSSHNWAINGAPILTAGRPLVNPPGPEYFENLRKQRENIRDYW